MIYYGLHLGSAYYDVSNNMRIYMQPSVTPI